MFTKKVYEDFVDLSVGRVYIKPLTNKVLDRALKISTVIKSGVNNAVFLGYCERKMTKLAFWKWGSLTIRDGNILREKVKGMLLADDILKKENKVVTDDADFGKVSPADQDFFNVAMQRQKGLN